MEFVDKHFQNIKENEKVLKKFLAIVEFPITKENLTKALDNRKVCWFGWRSRLESNFEKTIKFFTWLTAENIAQCVNAPATFTLRGLRKRELITPNSSIVCVIKDNTSSFTVGKSYKINNALGVYDNTDHIWYNPTGFFYVVNTDNTPRGTIKPVPPYAGWKFQTEVGNPLIMQESVLADHYTIINDKTGESNDWTISDCKRLVEEGTWFDYKEPDVPKKKESKEPKFKQGDRVVCTNFKSGIYKIHPGLLKQLSVGDVHVIKDVQHNNYGEGVHSLDFEGAYYTYPEDSFELAEESTCTSSDTLNSLDTLNLDVQVNTSNSDAYLSSDTLDAQKYIINSTLLQSVNMKSDIKYNTGNQTMKPTYIDLLVPSSPFAETKVTTIYGRDIKQMDENALRDALLRVASERKGLSELGLGDSVKKGSYQDRQLKALDAARVALIDALDKLEK